MDANGSRVAAGASGAVPPPMRESTDPFGDELGPVGSATEPSSRQSSDPFADDFTAVSKIPATHREDSDPFATEETAGTQAPSRAEASDDPFADASSSTPASAVKQQDATASDSKAAAHADDPFADVMAASPAPVGRAPFAGGGFPTGPVGSFQSMSGGGLPPLGAGGMSMPPGVISSGGLPPLGGGHPLGGGGAGPHQYASMGMPGHGTATQ